MALSRHHPMPPAASAAVAIRKSRSARFKAATATSPSTISMAGTSSKAVTQTRRVRSRPSWPETVHHSDLGSIRNIAGTDSTTAGTTTTSAAWAARTYHRWPYSRQPPGARSARTLSGPNTQRPPSSAAATVAITDPSASNGSHRSLATRSPVASNMPPASAVARSGPGYRTRPSSLCTTLASTWDRPRPPNSRGMVSPVSPNSLTRRACSSGLYPVRVSSAARSAAAGSWPARNPRRVSCRACWSSLRGRVSLLVMAAPSRFMLADGSSSFRAIRGWCLLAYSCLLDGAARPVDVRQQLRVRAGERAGRGGVAAQLVLQPGRGVAEEATGVPAVRGVLDRGVVGQLAVGGEDDAERGVHGGAVEVRLLGGGAGDDRVPDAVGGGEEDGLGQRGRVRRAVGGGRAVRVGAGPDRVRQRERHDGLDQGRVLGGGLHGAAGALRGADR